MSNTALLLIDFQNDYFPSIEGAKWKLVDTERASNQAAKLLTDFRKNGLPVVHVRHEFLTNEGPFFHPNSEGAQIHSSVMPITGEPVVLKNQINSFRETDLKEILDSQNIKNLVIVGAMSHMCIDAITRAAVDLGYNCSVAHDACATLDLEFNGITVPAAHVHSAFMAALSFAYANVASTDELLRSI